MNSKILSVLTVDKNQYCEYEKEMLEVNAQVLKLFSAIVSVILVAMCVVSTFESLLSYKTSFYGIYFVICLLFFLTGKFVKKRSNAVRVVVAA